MADTSPNPEQQELYARSQDIILCYNPTNQDILVGWDLARGGVNWLFPNKDKVYDERYGKGFRTVPAYIALQYLKILSNAVVDEIVNQKVKEENDRRTAIPGGQPMNLFEERLKFDTQLRIQYAYLIKNNGDNPDCRKLVQWKVITAYGSVEHPDTPTESTQNMDLKFILGQSEQPVISTVTVKTSPKTASSEKVDQSTAKDKAIEALSQ